MYKRIYKTISIMLCGMFLTGSMTVYANTLPSDVITEENIKYAAEHMQNKKTVSSAEDFDNKYSLDEIMKRCASIEYTEYQMAGDDKYEIGKAEIGKDTVVFYAKRAGLIDDEYNIIKSYDLKNSRCITKMTVNNEIEEKTDVYEDPEKCRDDIRKACCLSLISKEDVLYRTEEDNGVYKAYFKEYFNGMEDPDTYADKCCVIDEETGDILSVEMTNIIDGQAYDKYIAENFKYH